MQTQIKAASFILAGLLTVAAHADIVYTSSSAFAAATTAGTTQTFGTGSGGFYANASFPGGSFTAGQFTIGSPGSYINVDEADYYTFNGGSPTYPDGNYIIIFNASPDVITISFPSATAFSLNLGGTFGPGEAFTYTLSDGTTGSFTAAGFVTSGNALDFLGFTSHTPLTSITLSSADGSDYATYDNLTTASAIPEPSTLTLLGTGLMGAFGFLRRRKRS